MKKETKLMRIENQWKYKTIKEAEKEADAIKAFATRLAKRNNWSCKAVIVASKHSLKLHYVKFMKSGDKGRPTKKFFKKCKWKNTKNIQPHLHILVYANPAETLTCKIVNNINSRYKKKYTYCKKRTISRKRPVYGDQNYYTGYVMHQATSCRYVDVDTAEIMRDFDFKTEYEKAKPKLF